MRAPLLTSLILLAAAGGRFGAAKPRVLLKTRLGPVVLELEPDAAPRTTDNFIRYVKKGFYNGTIFHRVIAGFMIQGGGFTSDLVEKPTDPPIPNEARAAAKVGLRNVRGTIAMARTSNPDSATAQFFINTVDNPALDPRGEGAAGAGYCVFGKVVDGMTAVEKIEKVNTLPRHGMENVPELPVKILSAEVLAPTQE